MSYIKLTCPLCKTKHEVSNFYLKSNNIISNENLVKNLCNCKNINKLDIISDQNIIEVGTRHIFKEEAEDQFLITNFKDNTRVHSVYNYIPQRKLNFKYFADFHIAVKKAETFFAKEWNKKELLLRHKCQKNLRSSNYWAEFFKFMNSHNIDHDNSYLILRALKERDKLYINFISKRLNSMLKNKDITVCRIPSSTKGKENGCDDVINELCMLNHNLINGSDCLNRISDTPKAHHGGLRSVEVHLASSKIQNQDLLNDKNVLLIDDIVTTGCSAIAFSKLIKKKTTPKSLTIFIFGKTES